MDGGQGSLQAKRLLRSGLLADVRTTDIGLLHVAVSGSRHGSDICWWRTAYIAPLPEWPGEQDQRLFGDRAFTPEARTAYCRAALRVGPCA